MKKYNLAFEVNFGNKNIAIFAGRTMYNANKA